MYLKIERPTVFISRTPSPPRLPLPRRINFRVRQRRRIPYICQCRINFRTRRLRRCTQSFQPWQHPNAATYADTTKTATPPLRRCRYLLRCCAPPISPFLPLPQFLPFPRFPTFPPLPTFPLFPSSPQFLRSLRFPRFPRCHYPLFFLRRKKFPEIKCAAT